MIISNLCVLFLGISLSGWASAVSSYPDVAGDMPILVYETSFTYVVAKQKGLNPKYGRTISVKIKIPEALALGEGKVDQALPAETAPIVIYSHGGASGLNHGHTDTSNQNWTNELVARGYITINIAHSRLPGTKELISSCNKAGISNSPAFGLTYDFDAPDDNTSLLETFGYPLDSDGDCAYFNSTQYLRYRDVMAVLNRLDTVLAAEAPEMAALWDGQLALMGHSAGTGSVMSMAGARRTFLSSKNTYITRDQTRFDAYVALSPQSETEEPHTNGYAANAWTGIEQPILMITGEEDNTANQASKLRINPYNNMPDDPLSNDKFLVWFKGPASGHAEMALNKSAHTKSSKRERDAQKVVAIRTVERFLDIYTRSKSTLLLDESYVNNNYTLVDFDNK